jgi:hypothetical protein
MRPQDVRCKQQPRWPHTKTAVRAPQTPSVKLTTRPAPGVGGPSVAAAAGVVPRKQARLTKGGEHHQHEADKPPPKHPDVEGPAPSFKLDVAPATGGCSLILPALQQVHRRTAAVPSTSTTARKQPRHRRSTGPGTRTDPANLVEDPPGPRTGAQNAAPRHEGPPTKATARAGCGPREKGDYSASTIAEGKHHPKPATPTPSSALTAKPPGVQSQRGGPAKVGGRPSEGSGCASVSEPVG